jgi:hypothetical protein
MSKKRPYVSFAAQPVVSGIDVPGQFIPPNTTMGSGAPMQTEEDEEDGSIPPEHLSAFEKNTALEGKNKRDLPGQNLKSRLIREITKKRQEKKI